MSPCTSRPVLALLAFLSYARGGPNPSSLRHRGQDPKEAPSNNENELHSILFLQQDEDSAFWGRLLKASMSTSLPITAAPSTSASPTVSSEPSTSPTDSPAPSTSPSFSPSGTPKCTTTSDFEDGTSEGWRVLNTHKGGTSTRCRPTGGNPDGHVLAHDQWEGPGTWWWRAPEKFHGDFSGAYGMTISFDYKQSSTDNPYMNRDIILRSDQNEVWYELDKYPSTSWETFSVELIGGAGWLNGDNSVATETDIRRVLSDLQDIWIRGGYSYGATGFMDNVILEASCTPGTDEKCTTISDFEGDDCMDGWEPIAEVVVYGAEPFYNSTGGNPGGHIYSKDASEGAFGTGVALHFQAPSKFHGNFLGAYNQIFSFDLRQSETEAQFSRWITFRSGESRMVSFMDAPGTDWTSYSFALNEDQGWFVWQGGVWDRLNKSYIQEILIDITDILIQAEFSLNYEDMVYLDNVVLNALC